MKTIFSIRLKLMAVVLLTTLIALLVAGGIILVNDASSYQAQRTQDMSTQIELLGYAAAPALQFGDRAVANENLGLLRIRPAVSAAAIYDTSGNLFASYTRSEQEAPLPDLPEDPSVRIDNDDVIIFTTIIQNGEFLGTAYMRADVLLRERIAYLLDILGVVAIGAMLAAVLLSYWLQAKITRPILSIAHVARHVISNRDYSPRVEKQSEDEVGMLVDDFNAMLSEIEQRTLALEASNSELEQEIEERQRAREEILRLNDELERKVQALHEADRHKDDFLATLAHELRNPLAPIRSGLEVLHTVEESKRAGIYTILERQTNQLIRLVDELMDVSRISRGKVQLQKQIVGLEEILQGAMEATSDLIRQKKHQLHVSVPEQPVLLNADPVRLTQVILNLLANAAHYTPTGGNISVTARAHDGLLRICVKDDGIGMTSEMLERVFEAFIQVENPLTRSRSQSGLGIGLTLARALVGMHDGRIYAQSEGAGRGTEFIVELPLVEAHDAAPAPRPDKAASSGVQRRILVVDDNEDAAGTLAMLLRLSGHEVRAVFSGRAALEAGEQFQPHIILTDLGMPGMSGIEVAKAVRQRDWGRNISLVAVSGWGQEEDKRTTREAGFDHHLVKPVEAADLLRLLEQLQPESLPDLL